MTSATKSSDALPISSSSKWSSSLSTLGPIVGLFFVFAFFSILQPKNFLSLENFQIILLNTAVVGTAALGSTIIIISGGIDLSVGSNIAMCTVVIAVCRRHDISPIASVLCGIAAGAAVGLLIGLL